MKKHLIRRIATLGVTAALCVGACAMFAGCTSNHPEITITYTFNDKDYKVGYTLSRIDAPNTVKHFIELADAGFYDGLCIHNFDSTYMYSGAYTLSDEGELEAVNYFEKVKELETEKKITFTQTVWNQDAPLYTVYGEFENNGNKPENGLEYRHTKGALVMYYTDKGNFNQKVKTVRNDGGDGNDGDPYDMKPYAANSATSLFYTYLGSSGNSSRDKSYCVFGMADYDDLKELLDAIDEYKESQTEDEESDYSFTEEHYIANVNEFEPFDDLLHGDISATYNTPVEKPIIIKSIKVNQY